MAEVAGSDCAPWPKSFQIMTSRSGSRYGSGRSSTPLTTLKIVVAAPSPAPEGEHDDQGEGGRAAQAAEGIGDVAADGIAHQRLGWR